MCVAQTLPTLQCHTHISNKQTTTHKNNKTKPLATQLGGGETPERNLLRELTEKRKGISRRKMGISNGIES